MVELLHHLFKESELNMLNVLFKLICLRVFGKCRPEIQETFLSDPLANMLNLQGKLVFTSLGNIEEGGVTANVRTDVVLADPSQTQFSFTRK